MGVFYRLFESMSTNPGALGRPAPAATPTQSATGQEVMFASLPCLAFDESDGNDGDHERHEDDDVDEVGLPDDIRRVLDGCESIVGQTSIGFTITCQPALRHNIRTIPTTPGCTARGFRIRPAPQLPQ